jgi:hypothetical protein
LVEGAIASADGSIGSASGEIAASGVTGSIAGSNSAVSIVLELSASSASKLDSVNDLFKVSPLIVSVDCSGESSADAIDNSSEIEIDSADVGSAIADCIIPNELAAANTPTKGHQNFINITQTPHT